MSARAGAPARMDIHVTQIASRAGDALLQPAAEDDARSDRGADEDDHQIVGALSRPGGALGPGRGGDIRG